MTEPQTCADCGARIMFRSTGTGLHYRWYAHPTKQDSWRCGHDPDFPVKAHRPA